MLSDDADGICELDRGPAIAPETARRLACDSSIVRMVRQTDGTVIEASDKYSSIPRRARRLVRARDKGCRFPGCGARAFVDVHHVQFRSSGGSGNPDNLVELCWFHHRLVHEGGWKLRLDDRGNVVVTNPSGNVIPTLRSTVGTSTGILDRNDRAGVDVGPTRSGRTGMAIGSTSITSRPLFSCGVDQRRVGCRGRPASGPRN